MKAKPITTRNPWTFIPTLYFAEGLPNVIISAVSVIIYKNLGIPNAQIAFYTSMLYWPWVLKMFWGPLVEVYSTKRKWIFFTQLAMMLSLGVAAASFQLDNFLVISLAAFTLGAFISATHDIAADGFYMLALNNEQQAFFVGIRSFFYRLAVIFGTGFLVVFAGQLADKINNVSLSWTIAIGLAAVIFAALSIYHQFLLPFPVQDAPTSKTENTRSFPFVEIIVSYFRQPKILITLAFILLYRFGEAMLLKLATPFFLDDRTAGGLGLTTADVGLVYGTFGVISLILGGILGGIVIARYGLKKCIFPMALALNLPDLFYVYMAYKQPSINLVYPLVSLEQFGYGLGFTAFTVYLMYICKGQYKTSHFAISTGIMALGLMLPGSVSGLLQEIVGYPEFFTLVCLLTIPGMIVIFFLPIDEKQGDQTP